MEPFGSDVHRNIMDNGNSTADQTATTLWSPLKKLCHRGKEWHCPPRHHYSLYIYVSKRATKRENGLNVTDGQIKKVRKEKERT